MDLKIDNGQSNLLSYVYGILIIGFFALTPWNRIWAEYIWAILSLISIAHLITDKVNKNRSPAPQEITQLLYILFLIPAISALSYITTPLENLPIGLLEPDIRWLLFIPIVISIYKAQINPTWVLLALMVYCVSAFSKGLIETKFASNLAIRAWGDENPNPFGMFNAMVTLMLSAYLLTPKQRLFKHSKHKTFIYLSIFICALLGLLSTFFTGTRTALITIAAGLILYLILNSKSKFIWLIAISIILSATLALTTQTGQLLQAKMLKIPSHTLDFFINNDSKSKRNSTGQRLEQWRGSVCVFKKHPFLGTGPRSARQAFGKYSNKEDCNLKLAVKPGPRQTHSVYFNTLLTLGLGGVLIFGLFFTKLFKLAKEHYINAIDIQKIAGVILFMYILSMAVNGIALDMWFRNYMVNKNLMALLLPLLIFAWPSNNKGDV